MAIMLTLSCIVFFKIVIGLFISFLKFCPLLAKFVQLILLACLILKEVGLLQRVLSRTLHEVDVQTIFR